MSQCDYIKRKRVAVELKMQSKLPSIIEAGKYINYKEFELENTITANKMKYEKILPSNSVNVFGMQINNPTNCASYELCAGTNSRINRKPMSGVQIYAFPLPIVRPHQTANKTTVCTFCE